MTTPFDIQPDLLMTTGIRARIKQSLTELLAGGSLRAKAIRGVAWLGSSSAADQGVRFLRNLILVRLLMPAAFGTVALVTSTGLVLQAFTEVGIREALVQNAKGAQTEFVNATWWMTFTRALLICSLLSLAAPWVSAFYRNPELTPLLRVAILGLLLEGAMSARAYVAIKDMSFSRWAMIFNGGGVLGVVITIILGFVMRDVWALVIGITTESAARCALSYALCPWVPSFHVDRESLRQLYGYSKGVFGLPLLMLVFLRTDVFVLGKLLPATQLGLYTMGIAIGQVPATIVSNLLYQVSLSTLSQIQEDKSRTNRVVTKVTSLVAALGMPALAFTYFCGGSVLTLIYGAAYAVSAVPLFLAVCAGLVSLANSQITGVFYAAGMPGLHRRCVAAMAAVMIVLIYPFSKWMGPTGAQFAGLASIVFGFGLQLERMTQFTHLRLYEYARAILRTAVPAGSVVIVCLAGRVLPGASRPLANIGLGMLGCLLAYTLGCITLFRQERLVPHSSAG